MSLPAGTRLGPYEIVGLLGAGGMGEVYRARDTRLNRDVAIKVLREALAESPQFHERFNREARAISRLDHPNICALYDVGNQNGTAYLVMQYLDGETLESRLTKGALAPEQALPIAMQIAAALDKAHRLGIVHGDLKPANVMLTRNGVKLLDFGLAQWVSPVGLTNASMVETRTSLMPGRVIGTLQYMSPEQLEGTEPDPRSDLWAFGCVLSEMLTGRPTFTGATAAAVIGAIGRDQPAESVTSGGAYVFLNDLIRQCLAKVREDRLQSAHDAMLQLTSIASHATESRPEQRQSPLRRTRALIGVTAGLALIVAAYWLGSRSHSGDREPLTLSVALPSDNALASTSAPLAISTDGRALAFVAADSAGVAHVWYRLLSQTAARVLPGTVGASRPFFSPDGTKIGFFAEGALKVIDVSAGSPRELAPAVAPSGGTWGADDVILYCPSPLGMFSVKASGGEVPRQVLSGEPSNTHQVVLMGEPTFLPDGHHFLYTRAAVVDRDRLEARVHVSSVDDTKTKEVLSVRSNAAYSAGALLYVEGDTLVARPFDLTTLAVRGTAQPIADHVRTSTNHSGAFAASANGRLVYAGMAADEHVLEWYDRVTRRPDSALRIIGEFALPSLSPDGRWIAGQRPEPESQYMQIWSYDVTTGKTVRMTDGQSETSAIWSGDNAWVYYAALRDGQRRIERQSVNRAASPELVADFGLDKVALPESITDDGRFLSFARTDPVTKSDVWILPLMGGGKAFPLANTPKEEMQSRLSPDGHWIAYTSNESGPWQVWLQPFPATGDKYEISVDGGGDAQWRGDSRELYYLRPDHTLMAVPIHAAPHFASAKAEPLFSTHTTDLVGVRNHYVPSRDGQRFLFASAPGNSGASQITIVVNWQDSLTSRMSTR
jgi:serine/threonine protein kinase/Tol biopolymer transport system component